MRWFMVVALPLVLSGCLMPTPLSLATFGLDAVSYAVSGKTVTDHGISLAMGEDCALIGLLEGEVCDDQPDYETANAGAILEPLPTSEQIALAGGGDSQVYASARRAAAAFGETWSTETADSVLIADLGAADLGAADLGDIAPAAGNVASNETHEPMVLSVTEQPPLPRSKPDHEVLASFEVVRDVVNSSAVEVTPPAAEGGSLADLANLALRAVANNGDLLLAALPEVTTDTESAEVQPHRPFWSEVGQAPQIAARIDGDTRRATIAKRFTRPMEVGG